MLGEKLFHAGLVEADPDGGRLLLITDHLGQGEGAGDEEQHRHCEEHPLPDVDRQEEDSAEHAEEAHPNAMVACRENAAVTFEVSLNVVMSRSLSWNAFRRMRETTQILSV